MISRRTCSVPTEDVFPRLLYSDSRCSQACGRRSQACGPRSQASRRRYQVLPGMSPALPGALRLVVGAPRLVAGAPRYSQVHLKATASVQLTVGFDHPGILVRQLSDTPRGSQWPKYILLMNESKWVYKWATMRSYSMPRYTVHWLPRTSGVHTACSYMLRLKCTAFSFVIGSPYSSVHLQIFDP